MLHRLQLGSRLRGNDGAVRCMLGIAQQNLGSRLRGNGIDQGLVQADGGADNSHRACIVEPAVQTCRALQLILSSRRRLDFRRPLPGRNSESIDEGQ